MTRLLVKRIVQCSVAVDSCTDNLVRMHRQSFELPAEKISLVENATNVRRFAPQDKWLARSGLHLEQFDPILGYVGGYPAERGGMQMLETASRLAKEYPRLGIVIVGDDSDGRLRILARERGLGQRTVLPGVVPYDLVPGFVNCFDVCFALDRPERFLVTGNSYQKVRQYLACGKAVITCLDDHSLLVRETLVENVAPDDLAAIEAAAAGC